MNAIPDSETASAHKNVVLYFDDEPLYTAAQQNNRLEYSYLHDGWHSALATRLRAMLRQHVFGLKDAHDCAPLQRRFEIIAQTNPGANAVRFNGRSLTYGELDSEADALALHLQQGGLLPGSFCVVGLEPSLAQVRAILAVLKAGAACLQCDPSLPCQPMAVVLALFRPSILFTRHGSRAEPAGAAMRTICCDEDAASLPHGWPDEFPVDARTPAHAVATVSDSGGLCIAVRTHKALGARLDAMHGACPPLAARPDPAGFWGPLSEGALLTFAAPA